MSSANESPTDHFLQSKWIRFTTILLISIGVARLFTQVSFVHFQNDFSHYYLGGMIYAEGKSPYTEHLLPYCEAWNVPYDEIIPYAAHPPLIQFTFGQLSRFSMPVAYSIWLVIQLTLLIGFVEVTRRLINVAWSNAYWLTFLAIFANCTAVMSLIHYSQVQMVIGFTTYSALLAVQRGRPAVACGLITFASAFKIYPVVLAPWFLFVGVKNPRDLLPRIVAMMAVSIGCIFVPGYQTWIDFVINGVPTLSHNAITWSNYSVQNFAAYMMRDVDAVLPYQRLVMSVLSVAFILSAYWATYRFKLSTRDAFCVVLVASTFGGIIAWPHYMTLMVLPICSVGIHALNRQPTWYRVVAFVAGMMILVPQADETFVAYNFDFMRMLVHFYPLFAILVLVYLLLFAAREIRKPPGEALTS